MLCAKRKLSGEPAVAYLETKANAPFVCPECDKEVILRRGSVRVNHFAHKPPITCDYGLGESDVHRRCKIAIYQSLLREPGVTKAGLERSLETCRPDVSAYINGVPVAIEVQISVLSMETIIQRTAEYARKGIYVLWLPQWTPDLDTQRYSPRLWEKWIHAAYFGRIYYWVGGLSVACYHLEPCLKHVPTTSWHSDKGKEMSGGGYTRRMKRYRVPIRGETLNLAKDFIPKEREFWKGGDFTVPFAKLFMNRNNWRTN